MEVDCVPGLAVVGLSMAAVADLRGILETRRFCIFEARPAMELALKAAG